MALSTPFVGSGQFAPERVWSCPVHDDDTSYRGDDWDGGYEDPWETAGEVCLDCVTGRWRDKKDAGGNVVMRELSFWDAALFSMPAPSFAAPLLANLLAKVAPLEASAKIDWLEDAPLPRIVA